MAAHRQVPDMDFGLNNASHNSTAVGGPSDSQTAALQLTVHSHHPQTGGEGPISLHTKDFSREPSWCICDKQFTRHDALLRHIKEQTPCGGCGARFRRGLGFNHSEDCRLNNIDSELHDQGAGALTTATTSGLPVPTNDDINSDLYLCSKGCSKEDGDTYFTMFDLVQHMIAVHFSEEQRTEISGVLQQQGGTSSQPDATLQPLQPGFGPNNASQSNEQGPASEYVRPSDVFWSAAASEDYDM
ncbi:hypothetical protein ABKA04_003230 [Annulohypoxylon sp. FPYF3050]